MHACIIPQSSDLKSTRRLSSDYAVGATPNSHTIPRFQGIFGQDSMTHDGPPTKHTGSSSSSSPTIINDFLGDDTNAFASLPAVVKHLTRVVRRAKEKHTPYDRKRPKTMELRFAEKYIGLTGMSPVDAKRVSSSMFVHTLFLIDIMSGQSVSRAWPEAHVLRSHCSSSPHEGG